jgi:hypothetical protein
VGCYSGRRPGGDAHLMSSAEASGSSVVRGAEFCHLACQAIRGFMF